MLPVAFTIALCCGLAHTNVISFHGVIYTLQVITHELPLNQAPEAYKTFNDKKDGCIKVVMHPWEEWGLQHLFKGHLALQDLLHVSPRRSGWSAFGILTLRCQNSVPLLRDVRPQWSERMTLFSCLFGCVFQFWCYCMCFSVLIHSAIACCPACVIFSSDAFCYCVSPCMCQFQCWYILPLRVTLHVPTLKCSGLYSCKLDDLKCCCHFHVAFLRRGWYMMNLCLLVPCRERQAWNARLFTVTFDEYDSNFPYFQHNSLCAGVVITCGTRKFPSCTSVM